MYLFLRQQEGWGKMRARYGVPLIFLYVGYVAMQRKSGLDVMGLGYVVAMGLGAGVVYFLSGVDDRRLPYWFAHMDRFLGRMAFPLVLIHLPVAALVTMVSPDMYYYDGEILHYFHPWEIVAFSLPLSLVAAVVLTVAVELPMAAWRRRLRDQSSSIMPI
jgi:peptidoglycan/LPS O-acetylase OafA/YrhL